MDLNATLLGQAITFALFVAFCMRYVWPPLLGAIEARQKVIADALAASEQANKHLVKVQSEAAEQRKKAKKQAQAIIEQANKHRAQIIEDARVKATQERDIILAQMHSKLEIERELIRQALCQQVGQLAIAGAEKVIERSIDAAANQDIIDQLVAELSFNKVS